MSKIRNAALKSVAKFQASREDGQGLAEYGLILALIAVVCIGALTLMGTSIDGKLGQINAAL
ncbi:MAG: Flp family type IVb pilin [Dehalococcoidia bacterium]|nr:Flp family type IVb pilin [Dehalococcoidia bacterium]